MEESLEEEASSSRSSYSSDRKIDNKLMRQALNYQFMMKGRSKTKNEMGEEMFLDSTVPETGQDPFSNTTDYKGCGLGVYGTWIKYYTTDCKIKKYSISIYQIDITVCSIINTFRSIEYIIVFVANPYLEIFNVATATAGIYPFETNTTEERKRLS